MINRDWSKVRRETVLVFVMTRDWISKVRKATGGFAKGKKKASRLNYIKMSN